MPILSNLKSFVERQYDSIRSDLVNQGQALANIAEHAQSLAGGNVDLAIEMMGRVIIGDNVRRPGTGAYFAGFAPRGAIGFAPPFQDESRQIMHAVAGLYMGSKYGGCRSRCSIWQRDYD